MDWIHSKFADIFFAIVEFAAFVWIFLDSRKKSNLPIKKTLLLASASMLGLAVLDVIKFENANVNRSIRGLLITVLVLYVYIIWKFNKTKSSEE